MCLKIDRVKKKTTVQGFEIFRIREKDIPVELLEVKEAVHSFSWEPHGNRFAMVSGEQPRFDISFYAVEKNIVLLSVLLTLFQSIDNHIRDSREEKHERPLLVAPG